MPYFAPGDMNVRSGPVDGEVGPGTGESEAIAGVALLVDAEGKVLGYNYGHTGA